MGKYKDMPLYKNIRKIRKEKGLSQTELAKLVGYADKTMISHIENGSIDLSRSKIVDFANALGVTPGYLMGWDVPKHGNNDITMFFEELLNNDSANQKEIEEVKSIIEKSTAEKTSKAFKMYDLYLNAPAHIQSAVESLLKGSQQN